MATETLSASGDGSIGPGETQHFDYELTNPTQGRRLMVYIEGDAESTDVTIEFQAEPISATDEFYPLAKFDKGAGATTFNELQDANVDLTAERNNRRGYELSAVLGAGRLRVTITNNATSGQVDPTVKVDEHDP